VTLLASVVFSDRSSLLLIYSGRWHTMDASAVSVPCPAEVAFHEASLVFPGRPIGCIVSLDCVEDSGLSRPTGTSSSSPATSGTPSTPPAIQQAHALLATALQRSQCARRRFESWLGSLPAADGASSNVPCVRPVLVRLPLPAAVEATAWEESDPARLQQLSEVSTRTERAALLASVLPLLRTTLSPP
jgi:hypothetical protein